MPTLLDEEISEMPVKLDLPPIKLGADYSFTVEIKDDNKAIIDTTDWDMDLVGRANGANGDALFTLGVGTGITHTPGLGRFVIEIPAATTAALAVTKVYWDVKLTDDSGKVTFPFEGIWDVLETSTR